MPQIEDPALIPAEIEQRVRRAYGALQEISTLSQQLREALHAAQAEAERARAAAQRAEQIGPDGEPVKRGRGRPKGAVDSYPRSRRAKRAAPPVVVRFA